MGRKRERKPRFLHRLRGLTINPTDLAGWRETVEEALLKGFLRDLVFGPEEYREEESPRHLVDLPLVEGVYRTRVHQRVRSWSRPRGLGLGEEAVQVSWVFEVAEGSPGVPVPGPGRTDLVCVDGEVRKIVSQGESFTDGLGAAIAKVYEARIHPQYEGWSPPLRKEPLLLRYANMRLVQDVEWEALIAREPTQLEGDANEARTLKNGHQLKQGECFVDLGGWTGNRCHVCRLWVWGGATSCMQCLDDSYDPEVEDLSRVLWIEADIPSIRDALGDRRFAADDERVLSSLEAFCTVASKICSEDIRPDVDRPSNFIPPLYQERDAVLIQTLVRSWHLWLWRTPVGRWCDEDVIERYLLEECPLETVCAEEEQTTEQNKEQS